MFLLPFGVVLISILLGARLGGVGLGVMGGLGLVILAFGFHIEPTAPPVDVLLMIASVVTASASLQAAGGIEYLVGLSEQFLRKHPSRITFYGPLVAYLFTFLIGTGHIAYSILPVIAEVARRTGVRPERPLSVAVIASQQAITASPISAATVALLSMTAPMGVNLFHICLIAIPSTLLGVLSASLVMNRWGADIEPDLTGLEMDPLSHKPMAPSRAAKGSTMLFIMTVLCIVVLGAIPTLRPSWNGQPRAMTALIETFMLTAGALILLLCRVSGERVTQMSIFRTGMTAVIAIFGIAWLGDSFFSHYKEDLRGLIQEVVLQYPWLFAGALFGFSILLFSQAATVRALMPLGIHLGLPTASLIAMFPAVNGFFVLPNYPTIVAAVQFDTTKTTRIGRYVINHSFLVPGLVATTVSVATGFLLAHWVL